MIIHLIRVYNVVIRNEGFDFSSMRCKNLIYLGLIFLVEYCMVSNLLDFFKDYTPKRV